MDKSTWFILPSEDNRKFWCTQLEKFLSPVVHTPTLDDLKNAHQQLEQAYTSLFPDSFWKLWRQLDYLGSQEWAKPARRDAHDDIRLPRKLQIKMLDHLNKLLVDLEQKEWNSLDDFLVEEVPLWQWITKFSKWVEQDSDCLEPLYEWNKCGRALQAASLLPKLNEKGIALGISCSKWFGFVPNLPYQKFLLFAETEEEGQQVFRKLIVSPPEKMDRATYFLHEALYYMAHVQTKEQGDEKAWNNFYSKFRFSQEAGILKTKGFGDCKELPISMVRLELKSNEIEQLCEAVGSDKNTSRCIQVNPSASILRDALMSPQDGHKVFMSSEFKTGCQTIYYDYLWRHYTFNPNSECDILGETWGFVVNLGCNMAAIVEYFQKEKSL